MDEKVILKLLDINKLFYQTFGDEFSATRMRIQPGVYQVLQSLKGNENILDLGCGNGEVARQLNNFGHRGAYVGIDNSTPLVEIAKEKSTTSSYSFLQLDIASNDWDINLYKQDFDVIFAFATLHHIPSHKFRLNLLKKIARILKPDGFFIHSNWQFLKSTRLRARIQPWGVLDIDNKDLENGDYLLDWKRGGTGFRYVHHFDEDELLKLANDSGFFIDNSFHSDGHGNKLSLYQTWKLINGND